MDEIITVSPRRDVFADESLTFHGYLPLQDPRIESILRGLCASPRGMRRGDVEQDATLKQPIPYVVLIRRPEAAGTEVYVYTRLTGGGEIRLHGKVSIGVGGHMNRLFTHETLAEVVWEEAERELAEELCFTDAAGAETAPPEALFVGLINDDSGPVQEVHLGLLAIAEIPQGTHVTVRETDQLEGKWEPVEELLLDPQRPIEEWSLHALDAIRQRDHRG